MDKVKVLVVGVGNWGRQHCLSIKKVPRAELVGVVGRNPEKVAAQAAEMGVKAFTSLIEAIELSKADAAMVVLAHSAHRQAAIELMAQGLHVYVEKSFGASFGDAEAMAEAARKTGVKLTAGFSQRYEPSYLALARLARSGNLGRIRYVFAKRQQSGGFTEGHWTAEPAMAGGGAVAAWGIHDVDLAMHLVGAEPRLVSAQMEFDEKGRETQSHILVRHESWAISEVGIEYLAFGADTFAWVLGEKGRADAERGGRLIVYRDEAPPDIHLFPQREYPAFLTDAISAFIDCIVSNSTPPIPPEDGVRAWKVVDAAYRSARTGESIRI